MNITALVVITFILKILPCIIWSFLGLLNPETHTPKSLNFNPFAIFFYFMLLCQELSHNAHLFHNAHLLHQSARKVVSNYNTVCNRVDVSSFLTLSTCFGVNVYLFILPQVLLML